MSMWNFDSVEEDIQSPREIVNNQCEELSRISGERVIARVTEYDGKYKSSEAFAYSEMIAPIFPNMDGIPAFDVQDIMGDKAIDEDHSNEFVYELFVTSKKTPKYKYRVLIMYYGILMYPVGLTIQKDIAQEIGLNSEGIQCKNSDEFICTLGKILGSNTLGNILKNLASMNPFVF